MNRINLRSANPEDLVQLVDLAQQLGYQDSYENIAKRFQELARSPDHAIIVAEGSSKKLVGFAHFKKHISLLVEPSLEVGGIVVDKDHRKLGIGKLLMEKAEQMAMDWKVTKIRLSSNVNRTEAHQFYIGLGFEQPKTSHFFSKTLTMK